MSESVYKTTFSTPWDSFCSTSQWLMILFWFDKKPAKSRQKSKIWGPSIFSRLHPRLHTRAVLSRFETTRFRPKITLHSDIDAPEQYYLRKLWCCVSECNLSDCHNMNCPSVLWLRSLPLVSPKELPLLTKLFENNHPSWDRTSVSPQHWLLVCNCEPVHTWAYCLVLQFFSWSRFFLVGLRRRAINVAQVDAWQ